MWNDDLRTANGNRQITTQTTSTVIDGKWNAGVDVYRGMSLDGLDREAVNRYCRAEEPFRSSPRLYDNQAPPLIDPAWPRVM